MALPTDTGPLYRAVLAALTTATGKPRALSSTQLFALGRPADLLNAPRAFESIRPRCFIAPITWAPIDAQFQMTDRRRIDATVEIRCWYYAGDGVIHGVDWERARARYDVEAIAVSDALCYPGALALDPDDATTTTGLDGGSLRDDDGRHSVSIAVEPRAQPTDSMIVRVTHRFRASVELSRPTT